MAHCVIASISPAEKPPSRAHSTDEVAIAPLEMLQYPEAALCTELWNRVGEIRRSSEARALQISWQLTASPLDDENTDGSSCTGSPEAATACAPTASETLTTAPARRRSAEGSAIGSGSTQRAVSYATLPSRQWRPSSQLARPGPSRPMPSTKTA